MAKILPDNEVKKLVGSVIVDAEAKLINPNGIELRLGNQVLFHSTSEMKDLKPETFLKVMPGESITIASLEKIDFRRETVEKLYPESSLMALITPTTTMMREGITQAATKVDAGFYGNLNWGLRNSSIKPFILRYGEPIFKLTFFILDKEESPSVLYGERDHDYYNATVGIKRSSRMIPADIPIENIISSSMSRLDPKKQLKEAGYPFDHIGTELMELHGKFEIVSADVRMMKDEFHNRVEDLSKKIESISGTITGKIDTIEKSLVDKVELIIQKKIFLIAGLIAGSIPIVWGAFDCLKNSGINSGIISSITVLFGIIVMIITLVLFK